MAKIIRKSSPSTRWGGLFNWEESFYGGIERLVYDFPYITIPNNIELVHRTRRYCTYFEEKSFKIFLLKVKEHGLFGKLLKLATSIPFEQLPFKPRFPIKACLMISKTDIDDCLSYIASRDADISSLFKDETVTKFLLEDSYIYILIKKEEDDGDDDGGNDGSDDNDDNGGNYDSSSAIKDAINVLKGVKKVERFSYSRESVSNGKHKEGLVFKKVNHNSKSTRYDKSQRKDAENLIRMLDINYDKKHDKIDSLKCGKLSPQKIAEVPAGNMHIYHRIEEDQATKPFSVVMLCDESGSMEGDLIKAQYQLVKTLYLTFSQLMPSENIFVFGHTGDATPDVYVYQDKLNQGFEQTIDDQLVRELCENYDGPVIEAIHERVRKQAPNDNILMIVISDGSPCGRNYGGYDAELELQRVVEKCKRDSFVIVGVGLYYNSVKTLYKYNTVIKDTDHLVENVSKVVNIAVKTEFQ